MDPKILKDPFQLRKLLWPDVQFYAKQREIIASVWENDETIVPAGNMLGKDFVAGFIALAFFLTRTPCRVITTSVDGSQLNGVLWGEIRRYIQTSRYPLNVEKGGPLVINHMHLRKMYRGEICGLSYTIGRVAQKGEGMLGHHIARTGDGVPRTLFIADEASGVDDTSIERADTWAHRKLLIGNPYPCQNYFRRAVAGGDILATA
jgi:phage terminase large subunit